MSDKIPDSTPPGAAVRHGDSTPTSSTSDNVSRSHGPGERHPDSTQTDNTSSLGASGHDLGARPKKRESFFERVMRIFMQTEIREITEEDMRKLKETDRQPKVQSNQSPELFVDDPLYFELYKKALSHGVEKDRSLRVNVVGNYNQGKTTLTKALSGQESTTIQSTNGVEISYCKYSDTLDSVQFCLKSSISDQTEINKRLATLVQNEKHTNILNQSKSVRLKNENRNLHAEGKHISKINEESKGIQLNNDSAEEIDDIIKLLKEGQCIKSEGDGDIQIWDFGGQFIFYATHTLFHSNRCVYLLIFDLTKKLSDVIEDPEFPDECVDKNMQQFAEYWMNSIHSYVGTDDGLQPPVILVGTHKDKLEGDEKMREAYKDKYFDEIRKLFEDTLIINHIQKKDFAIDCTNPNDSGIVALRNEIVHLHSKFKETEIPARWIPLEKAMLAEKHKKIIPYDKVVNIDLQNKIPLGDDENIKLFLLYHHAKGNLFFFDDGPISKHVVLDTQYLIDAFRCLVTSERFCKKDPTLRHLWKALRQEARLEMHLLENVWSLDEENDFLAHKNELLMFMQRHYIISEAVSYNEQTEKTQGLGWYVVPCFLHDHSSSEALTQFLNGKETRLRFAMSFNISPIVQIVYYRLIAALVGKWQIVSVNLSKRERKVLLYENLGAFDLDNHHVGIVEHCQNIIDLRVLCLCKSSSIKTAVVDMFRRFVVSNVESEFRKLRTTTTNQNKPFEICFRCNDESHCSEGSKQTMSMEKLRGENFLPCPDRISGHEINTQIAMSEWFQNNMNIILRNDRQLDKILLSRLSQTIGKHWELLGYKLGLSTVELDHISEDSKTAQMRRFNMLLKWIDLKPDDATVNKLIEAMKSTEGLSVKWDQVMNTVEEITSKQ